MLGHGSARIHLWPGAGVSAECRLRSGAQARQAPGGDTVKFDYALEYGTNSLEIHKDAIEKGQRVLIVDDLLATGGTAEATAKLAASLGAEIAGLGFVVELDFLKGRDKLKEYDVFRCCITTSRATNVEIGPALVGARGDVTLIV